MKTIAFFPTTLLLICAGSLNAQIRFFQASTHLEPGFNWLDSSFVVAAGDPALLAEIDLELAKPINERRHINGYIEAGNGGFNHNADFWFSWHMPPNNWGLADFSIEVCDGRPYTDVESDTAYWLHNVGQFCPWSSYIAREISAPTGTTDPSLLNATFLPIVPNPADEEMLVSWELKYGADVVLSVTDAMRRMTLSYPMGRQSAGIWTKSVATSALSEGLYYATLKVDNQRITRKFIVQH